VRIAKIAILVSIFALLFPFISSSAQTLTLKDIESRVSEYKSWLDKVGSNGSRYWVRLDSTKRPHRLFVSEGFAQATPGEKEHFVEIFSRYLAGHPEKNMLIDIFDASTGKVIGEYGFGGFKLFNASASSQQVLSLQP
jgi:hypothetical protein